MLSYMSVMCMQLLHVHVLHPCSSLMHAFPLVCNLHSCLFYLRLCTCNCIYTNGDIIGPCGLEQDDNTTFQTCVSKYGRLLGGNTSIF